MVKIKQSNEIKVKNYSSLAEYLIPQRPEYETLIRLRLKLFEITTLQEAYDYVQKEIVKIENQENIRSKI
tara:strand:+ start:1878 stop:2087 length:210 start_codon:yes stop_codon:yes gene_type:complete